MNRLGIVVGSALVLCLSAAAFGAAPVVVNQLHRSFSVREIHVAHGETIRFNNVDEFLHQIVIDSPTFKFSSNEQPPGQTVDVAFPVKGTFQVGCEIHPKMIMTVIVD